jgi:asparagine synthase (glutamine-hydrolysing)
LSAIFGIYGPADEHELQAMASRLAHTGEHTHIWSPAEQVFFGEIRNEPRSDAETAGLAAQLQLNLDWPALEETIYKRQLSRDGFSRQYLTELLSDDTVTAPEKIDGLFSMAYWDNSSRSLILASDRIGFYTLYYVDLGTRLAFASEYKALLALADFAPAPNPDALQFYISTRMSDPSSCMLSGINRVGQGCVVTVGEAGTKSINYWKARVKPASGSLSDHAAALQAVLLSQMSAMVAPYERIGVTLSGGLDSAALLGLLRQAAPEKDISTYTIGYGDSDPEIEGARRSAAAFGTDHHEVFFDPESVIRDLPYLIWLSEECTGREESILQYQIERFMGGKEEVVLAGHGADMVFGGMPRHRLIRLAELLPFARRPLMELFQQTQSGRPPQTLCGKLVSYLHYRGNSVAPPRVPGSSGPTIVAEPRSLAEYFEWTVVDMDVFRYHASTQAISRLNALVPFLATGIVELALRVPTKYKTGPKRNKIVLREAVRSLMPSDIVSRKKSIQRVNHDDRLSDMIDQLADEVLSPGSVRSRGLIDYSYIESIRKRPGSGPYPPEQLYRLWSVVATEIWCRTFIDNRGKPGVI